MFRKIGLVFLVFCFIFVSGGQSVSAMSLQMKPAEDDQATFEVVMNPVQDGFTTQTGTFGMLIKPFKNQLYATVWNWETGLVILRSPDGKKWESLGFPGPAADPCYMGGWDIAVFKGHLYIGLHDFGFCGMPGMIMRSDNGTDWEVAFTDDVSSPQVETRLLDKFGVTGNYLYFTTVPNGPGSGQIWRSPTGNPGSWELVKADLGNGSLDSTSTMVSFKGKIYFSGHDSDGVHVWKSADGTTWDIVGQGTLDDPANLSDSNITRFKNALYLSTSSTTGGRIYRSWDGKQWELVADGLAVTVNGLTVYKGQLVAFAVDTNTNVSYVYESRSGNPGSWKNLTPNPEGMGPDSNTMRGAQAVFKGKLYAASFFNAVKLYQMIEP